MSIQDACGLAIGLLICCGDGDVTTLRADEDIRAPVSRSFST